MNKKNFCIFSFIFFLFLFIPLNVKADTYVFDKVSSFDYSLEDLKLIDDYLNENLYSSDAFLNYKETYQYYFVSLLVTDSTDFSHYFFVYFYNQVPELVNGVENVYFSISPSVTLQGYFSNLSSSISFSVVTKKNTDLIYYTYYYRQQSVINIFQYYDSNFDLYLNSSCEKIPASFSYFNNVYYLNFDKKVATFRELLEFNSEDSSFDIQKKILFNFFDLVVVKINFLVSSILNSYISLSIIVIVIISIIIVLLRKFFMR